MHSTTMPLSDRDRRALLWGGGAIAVLLLYLLLRGGDSGPRAEPVQPEVVASTPAPEQPVTYAIPVEPTVVAAPVAVAPAAAVPVTDVSQLRLFGLLSRGAVIGMADGTQRFVPVGREIIPGVTLRGVDLHHAILATPSGEVLLGFDAAQPRESGPTVPVVQPGSPPTP
jgi:hypothetical protein